METKVIFASNLNKEDIKIVPKKVLELLKKFGELSDNPLITINNTRRLPERQANAMYDNESKGISIRYAAPGKEIQAIYAKNKSKPKEEVVKLMTAKIIELAMRGQLVSRHCITEEQYIKNPVIDIRKDIPNPRDFVRIAETFTDVSKIITPFTAFTSFPYTTKKVSIDINEPAIHVEF